VDGILINSGGTIVSVVHGFGGAAPAGQSFVALTTIDGLCAGQAAPTPVAQTLEATDAQMSRGLEDLTALLIAKGTIARTDLPAPLLAKINARRTLRGQSIL
jgi:hypothetical protein